MKITEDHEEIRRWAQRNGGKPQIIKDPEARGDEAGIRIDFPGPNDDAFVPNPGRDKQDVSWEEFFREFDRQDLVIEFDESVNENDPSLSYRFLKRKPVKESPPLRPEDIL